MFLINWTYFQCEVLGGYCSLSKLPVLRNSDIRRGILYDSNIIKTDLVLPPRSPFINFKLSRSDILTAEGLKS